MAGGRTSPTTSPRQRTSVESRDIVRSTQTFRETYPDIKSVEDFKDKKYIDLIKPLRTSPDKIPANAKKFLESMQKLEADLKTSAISQYSYEQAKTDVQSNQRNKLLFTQLERKAGDLQLALNVGAPKYETLFSALTQVEFEQNLKNPDIVHQSIANDADFKARAQRVFQFISDYRKTNKAKLEQKIIDDYLNDIFSATESTLDEKIKRSSIIKESSLTPLLRSKIDKGYKEYHLYRTTMEKRIRTVEMVQKSKETIFSKPEEYAKSAEKWIATKIQTIRENFAGMDGKEKAIAIATTLIGAAWFLNSNNEEVGKLRDILKKAGMVGIGYLAINTTSKAFTGKKVSDMFNTYVEDRSGKRDLLKESFNCNKSEAEVLSSSIGYMGDYKFAYLSKLYLQQKERYTQHPIPENMRELPVGGVAENEMSKHNMYVALRLVDRKLKASNSSMADVMRSINEAKKEAKDKGKKFVEPSYGMIITAILMNQDLAWKFGKNGKVELVFARDIETKWEDHDKKQTRQWWMLTGSPSDWREQANNPGKYPEEKIKDNHIKRISGNIMPETRPLSNFINQNRFGAYTSDYMKLYEHRYSKNPRKATHEWTNTKTNIMFMSSRVTVDAATFTGSEQAKIAAIQNSYQQALKELKKDPKYAAIKDRLHEFIQPVHGTFMAPSQTFNFGSQRFVSGKNKPLHYVMFLRMALPGSVEYKLRNDKEWPEGDMIEQMSQQPMKSRDRLTRSDFISLGTTKKGQREIKIGRTKVGAAEKPYSGAYESFLNNFGLKKSQTDLIDRILEFYSLKFINSGMSKAGLVRYLSSHKFSTAEMREALKQSSGTLPVIKYKFDIIDKVRLRTYAVVDAQNAISNFKNKDYLQKQLTSDVGTALIQACYGDLEALKTIKNIDSVLYDKVIALFKINKSTGAIGNLNVNSSQFDSNVLIPYEKVLLDYLTDPSKTNSTNKEIASYQAK
jgi:hypothetical protein